MPITPYMGLALPVQGTSVPDWSGLLNTAFSLIDSHDHSAGHGLQVPSAGININADLTFNGFNLTQARTLRLQQQAAAPALAADAGAIYVTTGGDLWYNNGAGQHVQITSGSALSAASLGGISGLGGTSAGVAFSNATKTFTFTQAANQGALLDAGPLTIHDTAASAFGITLQSPVGIAGAYALTLPTALPAANALLSIGTSGALSAFGTVSGSSLALLDKLTLAGGTTSVQVTVSGGFLLLQGNRIAADTTLADVIADSSVARTAGNLFGVRNNGTAKLYADWQGLLSLASQAAPIQPASMYTILSPDPSWGAGSIRYWKDATGVVRAHGTVTSAPGATAVIATLPAGFRPIISRFFVCYQASTNVVAPVFVDVAGRITLVSAPSGTFNYTFDSISFLAEV